MVIGLEFHDSGVAAQKDAFQVTAVFQYQGVGSRESVSGEGKEDKLSHGVS
jgi:hypothetical protein